MSLYQVDKVLERVLSLQPEESRLVFGEEILDWTDNYSETLLSTPDTPEAQHALSCIGSLWIEYATMEQNLRQWKKAVQVYDDALNDPVASRAVSVYLAYAELCKLRGKISSAQKVYIKGLTAGFPQSETDLIWRNFLLTMRENGSPDLTADQLYNAVSSQVGFQSLNKPGPLIEPPSEVNEPAPKRIKTEGDQSSSSSEPHFVSPGQRLSELLDKNPSVDHHSESNSARPLETSDEPLVLNDLFELSVQTVDDLLHSHSCRPMMLFRSLNPENMKQVTLSAAAGFSDIKKDLVDDVERYFNLRIPELCEIDRDAPESKVSRVLDIIEALWVSQGLNERYFDSWFSNLIQSQVKEESLLKGRLLDEEKQVTATSGQSTTLDILRSKQKIEFRNFKIKCDLQIQILNAYVNSVMEKILREQLMILSLIPNFPHNVVEKGEDGDGEQQERFALFKQIVNALLSIRLHSRSRLSFVKRSQSFESTSDISTENKEDLDLDDNYQRTVESVGALEAARAAAAATKKTTFKNKRRRNVPEVGTRYQQSLYTAHYGEPKAQYEYRSYPPLPGDQEISAAQSSTVASNLHKLAALLGKAKK